ncbi:MAG TPA: sigma-70 family RNA polymerase sigma factor [Verrucomicrobiae bacterium]|jgi:RNA polymerase sigma factor (sigma-70 family)
MQPTDDSVLLQRYVEDNSDEAFAALVTRHINLVYSVALRQIGDPGHAEEITQAVFIILARKAGQLRHSKAVSSWLFQTTRLTANNFARSEMRRQFREQEAHMRATLNESDNDLWPQIAPFLDDAIAGLHGKDRQVVLLRFYEDKNLREIGSALGASEDAAEKRIKRALEKLRRAFSKRGVNSTGSAIGESIATHVLQMAPATLAKSVTAVAIAKGSTALASTLTLVKGTMKTMTWLKIKSAVSAGVSVLLAASVATVALSQTGNNNKSAAQQTSINGENTNNMLSSYSQPVTNISNVTSGSPTIVRTQSNLFGLQTPTSARDKQLQNSFSQFPLFALATNTEGQPAFQTLTLTNPVSISNSTYYGFRFQVPSRMNEEDFVWAFVQPESFSGWYIMPQTGIMGGFINYFYTPKNIYPAADGLFPLNGRRMILQSLSGENLEDGHTYLIWFNFTQNHPRRISVAFTFTNLQSNSPDAIESGLHLDCQNYLVHPLSPPVVNPSNHHVYILLRPATWEESEAQAVALGGHLATVRNQAEEDWIFKTFGHYKWMQRLLWIGLSDREKKFHFSWSSGESASYTTWAPGEPNNAGRGEDYVSIFYPNHSQANHWNDWGDRTVDPIGLPMDGVVEIIPEQTNNPVNITPTAVTPAANAVAVLINPNVTITSNGGGIKLQWPVSASDYMLVATTNLSQPFTMFGYSEVTNEEIGTLYVTITNPVPQMFFRLQKP